MRIAIALLLLIAAAVHPVAHVADHALACPCVHVAVPELPAPLAAGLRFLTRHVAEPVLLTVATIFSSDLAQRGPPVA